MDQETVTKRKEMLEKLKKYVKSGENITFRYMRQPFTDGNCSYCAVGYLLNEVGFNFKEDDFLENSNGSSIYSVLNNYSEARKLTDFFTDSELDRLQDLNDDGPDGRKNLLMYIDELINKHK